MKVPIYSPKMTSNSFLTLKSNDMNSSYRVHTPSLTSPQITSPKAMSNYLLVEKVERDQMVKALKAVAPLLPLVSLQQYMKSKSAHEQAITLQQVETELMCT